jgi:probable F420-dependent oxidoreductase
MTGPRAFRFGLFAESVRGRADLLETARAAEECGYDTLLLRDHFVEAPFGHQLAPLAALTAVACATQRLRVGSLVFANDYRHPVVLAKEAATLDVLSEGRFELGIGAGFSGAEYRAAGLPFARAGVRVDRLEESVQVLKRLFAEEPASFAGRHYQLDRLDSYPKPLQRPHPPLLVAGGGRRILSLAGREADIAGILTVSTAGGSLVPDPTERLASTMERKIGWVREAAGERFSSLELSTTCLPLITDAPVEAAERLACDNGWSGIGAREVLAMPSVFIGSVERIVELFHERRERYGLSYFVVSDESLRAMAPVVERLAGT